MGADNHLTVDMADDDTETVVYEVRDWFDSYHPNSMGLFSTREKAEAVARQHDHEAKVRERVVE